jgi:uroporphyrinogen decarboxylase
MANQHDIYRPLQRAEVIKALKRQYPARVPMVRCRWWGEGLVQQYGDRLEALERYPEDATVILIEPMRYERMGLSWELSTAAAHDAKWVIDDWAKLDEFIAKLPDPAQDERWDQWRAQAGKAHAEDRYLLWGWWRLFFERPWQIRGMENLLTDFYLYPEEIHRLYDALCNLYIAYLRMGIRELNMDGFWTSDDLGNQKALFMKATMFRQFLKPYYARIGAFLKTNDLHWWLHSCGNNASIMDDLIEVGLDVFHPVQKGTMDMPAVARQYGDRITFLAGMDVQHALQECDPEGVRAEVRWLIDTFDRPDGGMCIASGNGIVAGTPYENIEAFLDEAVRYGAQHRAAVRATA